MRPEMVDRSIVPWTACDTEEEALAGGVALGCGAEPSEQAASSTRTTVIGRARRVSMLSLLLDQGVGSSTPPPFRPSTIYLAPYDGLGTHATQTLDPGAVSGTWQRTDRVSVGLDDSRASGSPLIQLIEERGGLAQRGDDGRPAHHERQCEELEDLLSRGLELVQPDHVVRDAVLAVPYHRDRQSHQLERLGGERSFLVGEVIELREPVEDARPPRPVAGCRARLPPDTTSAFLPSSPSQLRG